MIYSSFLSPASFWRPDHQISSPWAEHAPFAFWLVSALRPDLLVQSGSHCEAAYLAFCQAIGRLGLTTRCIAAAASEAGLETFGNNTVDLLHLAGNHPADHACCDFAAWRPKLSPQAIVLFDDTRGAGGQAALWSELSRKHRSFEFRNGNGLGVLAYGEALPEPVRRFFEAARDDAVADNIRTIYARLGASLDLGETPAGLRDSEAQTDGLTPPVQADATSSMPEDDRAAALKSEQDRLRDQLALALARIAHIEDALNSRAPGRIRRFATRIPSLLRARATLAPLNQATLLSLTESRAEWELLGDDPAFALSLARAAPLVPGHYRFHFTELSPLKLAERALLYVDTGAGFNEAETFPLRLAPTAMGGVTTTVILPAGAKRLRLDPGNQPGKLTVGSVSIRRVLATEYYTRLGLRLMRQRARRPADLARYARRAAGIVSKTGLSGLAQALRDTDRAPLHGAETYRRWIALNDTLTDTDVAAMRRQLDTLGDKPVISVVMPVYNTPETLLREAIESVRAQIYDNWELCIADDHSPQPHIRPMLVAYAAKDARIKVALRKENGHISEATNSAFELASGSWIALMDHDDILRPHALAEVALEIAKHPQAELIYSDEDKLNGKGERFDPYFKPDFSRELFRSQNYLNHLTVHRAANIRAVGGWRKGFEGSQDYDLNLRIFERIGAANIRHIPKVLYHWRAVAGSTAVSGSEKSYAYTAGLRALEEHVARTGLPARVEPAGDTPFYRLRFEVPEPQPLVSLIIPTRDKLDLLRGCIRSIRDKTTYKNYEIIVVDNGSVEDETLAYLAALDAEPRARVLRYDKPFNYSAINNFAVAQAKGSIIGLINNDIEVISPEWLSEMVSWAVQPDVGCVGAKLYYGNDTIQHAGVILGIGGVANHAHINLSRFLPGYFGRAVVINNFSAVTGACLLVRKDIYHKVGGLNARDLAVAFNDVDFCLKVRNAGYLNVWTPYAEMYHLESVSRGRDNTPEKRERFVREVAYMQETWAGSLQSDPYYSLHLSRKLPDFSLAV